VVARSPLRQSMIAQSSAGCGRDLRGDCMALSRVNLFALLVPCPVIALLCVPTQELEASACFASAAAVRQEYPDAWPSWTLRAADHNGVKCWFPASRENHSRSIEPASSSQAAERRRSDPDAPAVASSAVAPGEGMPDDDAPPAADGMNDLGWSFHSRSARIGGTLRDEEWIADRSFDDRFAAAFESNSLSRPSTIQYMMVLNLP
jgi:hypothetical protein